MKKKIQVLLCCLLACGMLTGCTNIRTQIAYTVYPIGYLISRISNNDVQYQSIQKDNAIIQVAEISDDYENILASSKVLFHIGDLEPYYSIYQSDIKSSGVYDYDLSANNAAYAFSRYTRKESEDGIIYESSPFYEGDAFDSIDMYQKDLCLWLDPITMLSMAKNIEEYLIQQSANNESIYRANYKSLESDLIDIDAQYQNLATSLEKNNEVIRFASVSASFCGWQKAYGFEIYPLVLSRYGSLPNEEQLQLIEERLVQDEVKYIAYESNMSDEMKELFDRVQSDLNLTRVDLSNLSSLSDEEINEGKDYISIFYQNLQNLESIVESRE